MAMLIRYFAELWGLLLEMSLYLLLGFAVAGALKSLFPKNFVSKHLGPRGFKSNLWASFFSIPLPLCSCGVVPAAAGLKRQGASDGSVVAFLTAAPQTGVDNAFVTASFLGWPMAIFKVVTTFFSGLTGGMAADWVSNDSGRLEQLADGADAEVKGLRGYLRYSFVELVTALRQWILIGLLLAAALSTLLPDDAFAGLSRDHYLLSYLVVLLISTPLYVCSTGGLPIVASLIAKGFTPGTAMVFLLAGPATNLATITVLWKALGRRVTLAYLANILVSSLAFGFVFDAFFAEGFTLGHGHVHAHGGAMHALHVAGAVVFLALVAWSYVSPRLGRSGREAEATGELAMQIEGVHCMKCVGRIKGGLFEEPGVAFVELDVAGNCRVGTRGEVAPERLRERVRSLGYGVKP